MRKKKLKCVSCGGLIAYNKELDTYICIECKMNHSSVIFKPSPKKKEKFLHLKTIRIFIALLGTLYLLWLIYRLFY